MTEERWGSGKKREESLSIPMIRHIHRSLLDFVPNQLDLVLHAQALPLHAPVARLRRRCIPHAHLHSPREPLLHVRTRILKQLRLLPMSINLHRAGEDLATPSLFAAVKAVHPLFVDRDGVLLGVQAEFARGYAVGHATYLFDRRFRVRNPSFLCSLLR